MNGLIVLMEATYEILKQTMVLPPIPWFQNSKMLIETDVGLYSN